MRKGKQAGNKKQQNRERTNGENRVSIVPTQETFVDSIEWKSLTLLHSESRAVAQGVWDFGNGIGLVKSGEEGELAQQLNVHENRENRALVTLMKEVEPLINDGGSKEFYHEDY